MITVLLIDDDTELLEIISLELLEYPQISVKTCNSANCARELIKTVRFDAIVCDYYMPEMNGCSLLQLLRSQGCDSRFILYSAKAPDDEIHNALATYLDEYIQRRGNPEEELSQLAAVIRASDGRKKQELFSKK